MYGEQHGRSRTGATALGVTLALGLLVWAAYLIGATTGPAAGRISVPPFSAMSRLSPDAQPSARITARSASRPHLSTAAIRYNTAGVGRLAITAIGSGRCTRPLRPWRRRPMVDVECLLG